MSASPMMNQPNPAEVRSSPTPSEICASPFTRLTEILNRAQRLSKTWKSMNASMRSGVSLRGLESLATWPTTLDGLSER